MQKSRINDLSFFVLFLLFFTHEGILANQCAELFSQLTYPMSSQYLIPDVKMQSVPLEKLNGGYMGYEFFRMAPLFSEPGKVREFVNNSSRKSTQGELVIELNNRDPFTNEPTGQPITQKEILAQIRAAIPDSFRKPLEDYVKAVLFDAKRRNHVFYTFTLRIRTEEFKYFVNGGHNHNHAGDLVYSRDEIGPNLEFDRLNRFDPDFVDESEYVKNSDRSLVVVIGDVWHRSPPLLPGQQRLNILIDLF